MKINFEDFSQDIMTQSDIAARRRADQEAKAQKRANRLWGAAAAAGTIAALAFLAGSGEEKPACHGNQAVHVEGGDTLASLKSEHINVTDGYVDLRRVDTTLTYEEHLPHGMTVTRFAENPGTIHPGDVLTMPEACES